jgi:hypothetical protein
MISQEKFIELIDKYVSGTITPAEHHELFAYIRSGKYDAVISTHIDQKLKEKPEGMSNLPAYRSEEIIRKVLQSDKETTLLIPKKSSRVRMIYWFAASAAVFVIAFLLFKPDFSTGEKKPALVTQAEPENNLLLTSNTSAAPLSILLQDGSSVTLQPGSSISYERDFVKDKREVKLKGEAFFNVVKNSKSPFFVYSNNLVAKVLGTSFNVKAEPEKLQMEVAVRTGRVQVYERTENVQAGKNKRNGVVLMPNQRVVYHEKSRQFVATLVEDPQPIEIAKLETFENSLAYEEVPLSNILPKLEEIYGIDIVVENENINRCLFTGDITKPNLLKKLDIICQALNASYEIVGTNILIRGSGCGELH